MGTKSAIVATLAWFLLAAGPVYAQTAAQTTRENPYTTQLPDDSDRSSQNEVQNVDQEGTDSTDQGASTENRLPAARAQQHSSQAGGDSRNSLEPRTSTTRRPRKARPLTGFEEFVASSTGRRLPIFGFDLFSETPSTFAPATDVPVTADYTIGPGDEIAVRTWGQIDLNNRGVVDRNGSYFLPRVGAIHLAGIRYNDLSDVIQKEISRYYRDFHVQVSMGQLRSVRVFVVGQAERPGVYTVSSLSTLTNALFSAGGPLPTGSMRRIQLKRGGQVVSELDLYDLLLRGDTSKDVRLQSSDVIFIPPAGPMAAVFGAVRTNAIFELKDASTVSDLVAMAGGTDTVAESTTALLERIEDHKDRKVEQVNLGADAQHAVRDGDLLRIRAISPKFTNAVILTGHVEHPGMFPWHQGMTLHDLIPSPEALVGRKYWELRNGVANSEGGLPQLNRLYPDLNWDYAVIERQDPQSLKTNLLPFSPTNVITGTEKVDLQANDVVRIFSQSDVSVPMQQRTRYVRVDGEVLRPGVYMANQGDTLKTLVERAGGLTPNAYLYGAAFYRESVRKQQQAAMDALVAQLQSETAGKTAAGTDKETDTRTARTQSANVTRKQELVSQLKALAADGRISLRLTPTATVSDLPILELQDSDEFTVPAVPSSVIVTGAVRVRSSFLYQKGKSAGQYLQMSGGSTKLGDGKQAFVIRANGSVAVANDLFHSGINGVDALPGDVVVVPSKEGLPLSENLKDWAQIATGFGLSAAAIAVLIK